MVFGGFWYQVLSFWWFLVVVGVMCQVSGGFWCQVSGFRWFLVVFGVRFQVFGGFWCFLVVFGGGGLGVNT